MTHIGDQSKPGPDPPGSGSNEPRAGVIGDGAGLTPASVRLLTIVGMLRETQRSIVYKAIRRHDGRPVALKIGRADGVLLGHEAAMLRACAGEGVLGLVDTTTVEGQSALVLEYLPDGCLADKIREGPLPPLLAARAALDTARALVNIHAQGVVHRNINPSKILFAAPEVRPDGSVLQVHRLAGFDLAARIAEGKLGLVAGEVIGNLRYVAPEQTGRTGHLVDARSDLYSLGVTLFEALSGAPPFPSKDPMELVAAHLSADPPALRDVAPQTPIPLCELVDILLRKDPNTRYQTAGGLVSDLERCVTDLEFNGGIDRFKLGRVDVSGLTLPHRLYGRQEATAGLRAAANRLGAEPVLVQVLGGPGSGKSMLLQQLAPELCGPGLVAGGTWEPTVSAPFKGFADAFNRLADQMLSWDDQRLQIWRERLGTALDGVGQVVTHLAPNFERILGPQPKLDAVGPAQTSARFDLAMRRFIQALCPDEPLVLVLDGFEHADTASRMLVENLSRATSLKLLIVVLSREHIDVACALKPIELGPLSPLDVETMLRDATGHFLPDADKLAHLTWEKTGGVPDHVHRFVSHLGRTSVLRLHNAGWEWDVESVKAAHVPGNVEAVLAQRVRRCAPQYVRMLVAATFLADPSSHKEICEFSHGEPEMVDRLVREGLLAQSPAGLSLAHPRLREVCRELADPQDLREFHARRGWHLVATLPAHEVQSRIYEVVDHLNHSSDSIGPKRRLQLAQLNADAGARALSDVAYETAIERYTTALEYLPEQGEAGLGLKAPGFQYPLNRARALCLAGRIDEGSSELRALSQRTEQIEALSQIYSIWGAGLAQWAGAEQARDVLLQGLARLGLRLPASPSRLRVLPRLLSNHYRIKRSTDETIAGIRPATDETARAVMELLQHLAAPAYLLDASLFVLTIETAVGLVLRYGRSQIAPFALATHGLVLIAALKDFRSAYRAGEFALAVLGQDNSHAMACRTRFVVTAFTRGFVRPYAELLAGMEECAALGHKTGDQQYATYALARWTNIAVLGGTPIETIAREATDRGAECRRQGEVKLSESLAAIAALFGGVDRGEYHPGDGTGDLDAIRQSDGSVGYYSVVAIQALVRFVGGDIDRLWTHLCRIQPDCSKILIADPSTVEISAVQALVASARIRIGRGADEAWTVLRARVRHLRGMCKRVDGNFAFKRWVVEAEVARHRRRYAAALNLYSRAAEDARKWDCGHWEAVAHEARSSLLTDLGRGDEAQTFRRLALRRYQQWGHTTKVRELTGAADLQAEPHLPTSTERPSGSGPRTPATDDAGLAMDLKSIIRATQSISEQLDVSGVLQAALVGAVENAGGKRALFLVARDDQWFVEAVLQDGTFECTHEALADYEALPASMVRFVLRRGDELVVANAAQDPRWMRDPYVRSHKVRSVLCLPLRRAAKQIGLLLVENSVMPDAFTDERVEVLRTIAHQASISLDSAQLYAEMETKVTDRTAQLGAKNEAMRLVLDNVDQGLLVLDRNGVVTGEHSAAVGAWLDIAPTSFGDIVHAVDPDCAAWWQCGWDSLMDGFLPVEVCLEQLPARLQAGDRTLGISWKEIKGSDGETDGSLVVLTDITLELEQRAYAEQQNELIAIFAGMIDDTNGFAEFFRESRRIVRSLAALAEPEEDIKRSIHTLKGNCALRGVTSVAHACHAVESTLEQDPGPTVADNLAPIHVAWADFEAAIESFRPKREFGQGVEVPQDAILAVAETLRREGNPLAEDVYAWTLEASQERLQRIGEQARALGELLEKPVEIAIEGESMALAPDRFSSFWSSFVHVVRNAIDHGVESPAERVAAGKPVSGLITLSTMRRGGDVIVAIQDDGRGIAWDKIRDCAANANLPHETQDDLVSALFRDGISSRDNVTALSGRGVGMSALLKETRALHGYVEVDSERGQGTHFRFVFPADAA